MWERNNGIGEPNILQNQFTAYLVTAVRRQKQKYLQDKAKVFRNELPIEINDYLSELKYEQDMLMILSVLSQLENSELHHLLANAKKRDLYILYAKALEERSFVDIAEELGMGYKAVAAAYYRMVAKIKSELEKQNEF